MGDASVPYAATLAAAVQWLETWRQTGRTRHLQTALACARIARALAQTGAADMTAHDLDSLSDIEAAYAEITSTLGAFCETAPELTGQTEAAPATTLCAGKDLGPASPGRSLPKETDGADPAERQASDR